MKTFDVTFSNGLRFGLFMYCADTAPSHADICAALKRRGVPDVVIKTLACRVDVVERFDFGDGKFPRTPSPRKIIGLATKEASLRNTQSEMMKATRCK
jgi:hypothetical protein